MTGVTLVNVLGCDAGGKTWRGFGPGDSGYSVRGGPSVAYAVTVTDIAALDSLVDEWFTVPEVADRLGLDPGKVRRLVHEGRLVAVRRGRSGVVSIPGAFLVPAHLENPANSTLRNPPATGGAVGRWAVLASLHGTFTLLHDAGFADAEAIEWLFTPDETLSSTPIEALRTGRKTAVRCIAQTLL